MAKLSKPFRFTHNLTKKVVRNLKIVTDILPVEVSGTVYANTNLPVTDLERYEVDIDYVVYKGMDVKELLEFTSDTMEEIEDAAIREASAIYNHQPYAA